MVDRPHKPSAISAASSGPQAQVDISADNSRVTAKLPSGELIEVYLYGASITSWNAHGKEQLFLSDKAILDGSKPIRGGVPVVFPNFGPPPKNHATSALPQHGFARQSVWEFLGKSTSESGAVSKAGDASVKLDFGLGPQNLSDEFRKQWPHDFGLVYSITLGTNGLQTMLNVRNEGKEAFEFQFLLHTYFHVKDITKTAVTGLMGTTYIDKVLDATTHQESKQEIRIAGEVDRVYKSIAQDTTSVLQDGKPSLDVIRDNLADTVVWNPWIQKSAGMADFGPKDGYKNMICVEVGAVDGFQKLEAGDTWEGGMIVKAHL